MNNTTARAGRVAAVAELNDVRLISMNVRLTNPNPERMFADLSTSQTWSRDGEVLACEVMAELAVRTDSDSVDDEAFRTDVTYSAIYLLDEADELEDADFEAFTGLIAVFNLHPYLRESLQSATVRCGLPAFIMPLLKSPLSTDDAADAIADDAQETGEGPALE